MVHLVPREAGAASFVHGELTNRVCTDQRHGLVEGHVDCEVVAYFFEVVRRRGFYGVGVRRALVPEVEFVLLGVQLEMIFEPNREERDDTVAPVTRPEQNLRRRLPFLICVFCPTKFRRDSIVRELVEGLQIRRPELCRVVDPSYHVVHEAQVRGQPRADLQLLVFAESFDDGFELRRKERAAGLGRLPAPRRFHLLHPADDAVDRRGPRRITDLRDLGPWRARVEHEVRPGFFPGQNSVASVVDRRILVWPRLCVAVHALLDVARDFVGGDALELLAAPLVARLVVPAGQGRHQHPHLRVVVLLLCLFAAAAA